MLANAVGVPWAVFLTVIALLSMAERIVFALTGSELDVVNRVVAVSYTHLTLPTKA